jgi:hypothetical protein
MSITSRAFSFLDSFEDIVVEDARSDSSVELLGLSIELLHTGPCLVKGKGSPLVSTERWGKRAKARSRVLAAHLLLLLQVRLSREVV